MKNTKKSLIASGISLAVSMALLAGSTFAWFTDSVTNKGNKIEAGSLAVGLWQKTDTLSDDQKAEVPALPADGDYTDISDSQTPVFGYDLWEPGYSDGAVLQVRNNGTLALKYELAFTGFDVKTGAENGGDASQDGNIAEVIDVYLLDEYRAPTAADTPSGTLADFMADPAIDSGVLASGVNSGDINIVVKMRETAGNEYQGASVEFDIELRATQAAQEEDGFGNADYDASANGNPDYPSWGTITTGRVTVPVATEGNTVIKDAEGVTTFTVPKEAIDENAEELVLNIVEEGAVHDGVPVDDDQAAQTYDISIEGLKEDNTAEVTVSFFIGTGLTGVEVYHYGNKIDNAVYDPDTGIVTFTSTSFSPYTIVSDIKGLVKTEAELMEAVKNSGTIVLGADIVSEELLSISDGTTIVLDLYGHKYESKYDGYAIENKGTLTINDSKGNGVVCHTGTKVESNYSHDAIRNFGVLTINGGTFGDCDNDRTNANPDNRGASVRNQSGAVCTINGGYFTCGDNYWQWGTGTGFSYAIRNMGQMTINGGTLYGAMNGGIASEESGEMTIKGGEFSVTGKTSYYVLLTGGLGEIHIEGGTFIKENGNGGLLGGFDGMPSWDASDALEENRFYITGGTFVLNGESVEF